jgi:hypothetical protein
MYKSSGNVAVLLDGEDLAATHTLSHSQAFSEIWVINNGVHSDVSTMRQRAGRIMKAHPGLTVHVEEAWLSEWLRTKSQHLRGRVDLLWADFCGTWDWERRDPVLGSVVAIQEVARARLLAQYAKLAVTVSTRYALGVDYETQIARTLCSDVTYEFKRNQSSAVPCMQTSKLHGSKAWDAYRGVRGGGMVFVMWEITHDRCPGQVSMDRGAWLVYWDPDDALEPTWKIWSVTLVRQGKSRTRVRFPTAECVSVPNIQVKHSELEALAYREAMLAMEPEPEPGPEPEPRGITLCHEPDFEITFDCL